MAVKNWCQEWQDEQDYRDWRNCLERAISRGDYPRVIELVEEGLYSEYDFPNIDDAKTLEIIASIKNR